ncbi:MAG: hypothetical protein Hals2KO_16200 [Halioglobus sp.]
MQVYIHIGYPKTGSSAIQSHIFTNQGWFEKRGVYIPRTGYTSGRGHARLINADLKRLALKSEAELPAEVRLQELAEELAARAEEGIETALISWEGLAAISPPTMAKIHRALAGHQVTILCYVRDQVSLYQAAALKTLEVQGYVSARSFFDPPDITDEELQLYDFAAALTHWHDAFEGSASVRVRLFERSCLVAGDVVTDFLHWLGLEIDDDFTLQTRVVNSTLDSRAAAALLIAKVTRVAQPELMRLTGALLEVAGNSDGNVKDFLPASSRQRIHDHFSASNAQLLEQFRPENAPAGSSELFPDLREAKTSPVFDYLRSVFLALDTPGPRVWDGGALEGRQVAQLIRPPGSGWRGAEPDGAWSMGPRSTIEFLLPDIHRQRGPGAIALHFHGNYRPGHSDTVLKINDEEQRLNLRDQEVRATIDDAMCENGVRVELQHHFPDSGEENAGAGELAFKLMRISYRFIWD